MIASSLRAKPRHRFRKGGFELLISHVGACRHRTDEQIIPAGNPSVMETKDLAQAALDAIAHYSDADGFAHGQSQARAPLASAVGIHREICRPQACTQPIASGEFRPRGQALVLPKPLLHARLHRQACAPFLASAFQNLASIAGGHTLSEPVGPPSLDPTRLIRPFHPGSPTPSHAPAIVSLRVGSSPTRVRF